MAKSDQKLSFTRIARRYLTEHASVRDCLLRGLINYSALAREIADLYQVENVDALQIACRRFRSQREDSQGSSEAIVRKLVREAKIRVRNKIAVVTIAKPDDLEQIYSFQTTVRRARGDFNLIEADEAMTIVVSQDWVNEITKRFSSKVKKTSSGLVQIAMIFDRRIEITPGDAGADFERSLKGKPAKPLSKSPSK